MDFLTTRPVEIAQLALDGLAERNKILAANVANADTPGYQRSDVVFENQLAKILQEDNEKQSDQGSIGLKYTPNYLDSGFSDISVNSSAAEISSRDDLYRAFSPEVISDKSPALKPDGNNVNIEHEMAEMAKNGTKYTIISDLESRQIKYVQDVIRGAL